MLKGGMSKDKLRNWIPTIFIKRNGRAQRAWKGSVYDIRYEEKEGRIYFKVEIDREISVPPEYAEYQSGWYLEEDEMPLEAVNYPPLFYILNTTRDYNEFVPIFCTK